MHHYAFNPRSGNDKLGPIPASMTSRDSCPDECSYKGSGCFAEGGRVAMHWFKLDRAGLTLDQLTQLIREIRAGRVWRHNVGGDLPKTKSGRINRRDLRKLVKANRGRRGYTYTHFTPTVRENRLAIREAIANGFTVNLSANTVAEAVGYRNEHNLPTVAVVPPEFWGDSVAVDVEGHSVVRCPAEYRKEVTCSTCQACAVPDRKSIIGFTTHGQRKNAAAIVARG